MRGATEAVEILLAKVNISIHAPREGSDLHNGLTYRTDTGFQSTLPVRGATELMYKNGVSIHISIHAPREGSDPDLLGPSNLLGYFNPRSP